MTKKVKINSLFIINARWLHTQNPVTLHFSTPQHPIYIVDFETMDIKLNIAFVVILLYAVAVSGQFYDNDDNNDNDPRGFDRNERRG